MTDFTLPPEGMLSEQIALPEHSLALGLQHREGAGLRVVVWDGQVYRHMSAAAAKRWATMLEDEGPVFASFMKPVIEACRALAARVLEIEAAVAERKLADVEVEGNA